MDDAKPLDNNADEKIIQQVVGSFLFYGRAVDPMTLHSLNTQLTIHKLTLQQQEQTKKILDYIQTYLDATIQYYASDMILNVNSDASYLNTPKAQS